MKADDARFGSWVHDLSIVLCGIVVGLTSFLILARSFGLHPALTGGMTIAAVVALTASVAFGVFWTGRRHGISAFVSIPLVAMITGAWIMVLILVSSLSSYVAVPADIVGFGENGFINFILKFREGYPLYTPGPDNNTVPYTPGAPILTYLVASLLGDGTSIPLLRGLTTATAILAGVGFAFGTANLAMLIRGERIENQMVWIATWACFLILLAFDDRFNLYTHTIHNDSAALLVAACGFWTMTRHALKDERWLLAVMVLLPSFGFMIKQSQLMWVGVFPLYLFISRRPREAIAVGSLGLLAYVATLVSSWWLWGANFIFWVFLALGAKDVSLVRVVYHLLEAGVPIGFLLFGGWHSVWDRACRKPLAVWVCSLLTLLLGVWTSGAVWVHNHLGPGVMMSACWFFVGILRVWPSLEAAGSRPLMVSGMQRSLIAFALVAFFAGLGHLRDPRGSVPEDISRYIAETEAEFVGENPERVLLDNGNWIYLKSGTLMRDRATPLAVHIGPNQSKMNLQMLEATKERIRSGVYDKILAHELNTPRTAYDFGHRGSGIPELIFKYYRESHRIPGVKGITTWWPTQMVSEVVVLVRKRDGARPE